tara:strand:- start:161 stop:541 length:381 start_codon:yes stop_codon:yes gene_type:complete
MSKLLPIITFRAWSKINDILSYVRTTAMIYSAEAGGCNGFNFKLDVLGDKHKQQLDQNKLPPTVLDNSYNNKIVYIDPLSEMFLYKTEIDFIHEDYEKKIFESKFVFNIDPTILSGCGCGISFHLK